MSALPAIDSLHRVRIKVNRIRDKNERGKPNSGKVTAHLLLMINNGNFSIFPMSNKSCTKSSEFHRLVQSEGWTKVMQAGSLVIYERNGRKVTVPYHGSAEMPKGLENKLRKEMGL